VLLLCRIETVRTVSVAAKVNACTDDGSMRSAGTKSTLVKSLKEETKVKTTTHLPLEPRKTAVIIDAMFANDSGLSGKASHLGQ